MIAARRKIENLRERADLVRNGGAQHDPQIHNDAFCTRVLTHGSLDLGESYMDGWWDAADLDQRVRGG
jgi:cyclopropane-fatty-acyl-phospholipid synthase